MFIECVKHKQFAFKAHVGPWPTYSYLSTIYNAGIFDIAAVLDIARVFDIAAIFDITAIFDIAAIFDINEVSQRPQPFMAAIFRLAHMWRFKPRKMDPKIKVTGTNRIID